MSDQNLGRYIAGVVADVTRANNERLEERFEERMSAIASQGGGLQHPRLPQFGNPVYLGGEEIALAGATVDVVIKVSASRDLKVISLSISQDGTPVDRLDPWQSDLRLVHYRFTAMTKDDEYDHVIDGEIMVGDLFGRDDQETDIDVIKASQDVTFTFRNTDPFNAHRVNVSMRCGFWPPILYGLKPVTEKNLFELRPNS